MEIYVAREGQRAGPYSLEEVNRQLASGHLSPVDQAWSESSPGWKPVLNFPGVIMPGGASSTAVPVATATVPHHDVPRYAGFWIRALAFLVDCLILAFPAALIQIGIGPPPADPSAGSPYLAAAMTGLLNLIYFAGFWASPMQATLGQKICRIKVADAILLSRISALQAIGRFFSLCLSLAICLVGVVMIGLSRRKLGLHDVLSGTCVLRDQLSE